MTDMIVVTPSWFRSSGQFHLIKVVVFHELPGAGADPEAVLEIPLRRPVPED